jgi:hypothetical protein
MSGKILISTITVGTTKHFAGDTIPDAQVQAGIVSAGGTLVDPVLWPGLVAQAALAAAERRDGRVENAERIMAAAVSVVSPAVNGGAGQGAGSSVLVATATFALAELTALGAGVKTLDKTLAVLPTGARVLSVSEEGVTLFDDPTHGTFALTVGSSAGGNQVATTVSVAAGASGFPKVGPAGAAGYLGASQSGATISVRLTSSVDLNTATVGAATAKFFYTVAA